MPGRYFAASLPANFVLAQGIYVLSNCILMGKARGPNLDIRQASLDAARRLFADRGFEGTSIQDVASEVGVSKQAVLHHFPSKAELRDAVLEQLIEHWGSVLPRLLLEATGGYRRFNTVFGTLVRFFNDEPAWAKLVVREVLDRPDYTHDHLKLILRPWIDTIAEVVRAGQGMAILRSETDSKAWVVEMLLMALFGAAAHPVFAGIIEEEGKQRLDQELNRIAATSLFRDPVPEPEPKPPELKTLKKK